LFNKNEDIAHFVILSIMKVELKEKDAFACSTMVKKVLL